MLDLEDDAQAERFGTRIKTLHASQEALEMALAAADLVIGAGYDPNDPKFQGADQLAVEWAKAHGVPGFCYPADRKSTRLNSSH